MFLIKLLAAAFLVSLNIFTFLLIKFQKNDRDNELLKSVAEGNPEDVQYEAALKPNHKDMQKASVVLQSSKNEEESKKQTTSQYNHVLQDKSFDENLDNDDDDDDDEIENNDFKGNHQAYEHQNQDNAIKHNNGSNGEDKQKNEKNKKDSSYLAENPPEPLDKSQKKKEKKKLVNKYSKKPVSDIKLLVCALLGGAFGIYIALFSFRYRLRDLIMMVLIPTILVLNIYVYFNIFTVWLISPAELVSMIQMFNLKNIN